MANQQANRVLEALRSGIPSLSADEQGLLAANVGRFADRTAAALRDLDAAQRVTSEDLATRVNVVQKQR